MLHQHGLPYSLWREAVTYTTHLKNRSPTRAIKEYKVPDKVFWGKKPDVSHLQEFGRACWVLQQNGDPSKLDPKSREFIFVGIADGTKGYRYYNTKTHQILTSQNVVFMAEVEKPDEVEVTHPTRLEGESGVVSRSDLLAAQTRRHSTGISAARIRKGNHEINYSIGIPMQCTQLEDKVENSVERSGPRASRTVTDPSYKSCSVDDTRPGNTTKTY